MSATPITATVQTGPRAALPVSNATLVIGAASAGTDNAIVKISSTSELLEEFAATSTAPGPLCHCAALYLSITGQPVYCMRINDSVAATMGSVTKTAAGSTNGTVANNSSVPVDAFSVIVEILSTGTVAAGTFTYRYSLDGGDNYTGTITGPTHASGSASASLGTTGISITFADGSSPTGFTDGDLFTFTTSAPGWGTSDLQAALDAFISSEYRIRRIHVVGVSSSTIHAAIITRLATAFAGYKYTRVIEETDDQTGGESVSGWANSVLVDYASASNRTVVAAGWIEASLVLNQDSLALQLRRPVAWTIGPRQAAIDVSEDAGAVKDGALTGIVVSDVYPFAQDGRLYTGYEGRGYTYAQSYLGRSGVYCAGAFTRSDSADASHRLAHGQVLDVLLETMYDQLLEYINTNVPANSDGTIEESAAASIEAQLNSAVEQTVVNVSPQRISPSSSRSYCVVDRANVIATTRQLRVTLAYQQRPFVDSVALFVSQTLSVPVA
jgi:hypothetical protein